ncbi:exopolyphosphatase PRUNE1 isoform X1 [Parasteatoda tepidariorum]|uniref:exopolyphosphatase PRUNE1 isoform X1 n=2 Tax=Parasteatoda tepidariorum TaxID=114398 RepID=UPI0039BD3D07
MTSILISCVLFRTKFIICGRKVISFNFKTCCNKSISIAMENYLKKQKEKLKDEKGVFKVVMGNESCDLDSVVSSLVFAYFLYKVNKTTEFIVPVLNVCGKDLLLRTEVVYFLKKTNIDLEHLMCEEDINLQTLKDQNRLKLIIVDHNALSEEQTSLQGTIVQIIDHHKINNPETISRIDSKIEDVGSCSTLIAEEILKFPNLIDSQIALLLLGTILLDTVCLQESAKRVTEKDKVVAAKLEKYIKDINKEELFQELLHAKFDTSNLSPEQLLRKDTKYISNGATNVAIASLPLLLKDIIQDDEFLLALEQLSIQKNLSFIVILGSQIVEDNGLVKRQIAIYDKSQQFLNKVTSYLVGLENPSLCLCHVPVPISCVHLFEQENSSLSRKFILPAIQKHLYSENCVT